MMMIENLNSQTTKLQNRVMNQRLTKLMILSPDHRISLIVQNIKMKMEISLDKLKMA